MYLILFILNQNEQKYILLLRADAARRKTMMPRGDICDRHMSHTSPCAHVCDCSCVRVCARVCACVCK